jgi:hypothetical protein
MFWPSPPLSMRRCLSRCTPTSLSQCAVASLVAPLPLSPRKRLSHCASLAPAVGCCIATSLDAPSPLLLHRRLSLSVRPCLSCCATASIATQTPVSLRLSHASGWLLHRHLSRRASASLVMPVPLSLRRHLSCCAAASLVAPHLRWLGVASSTILTCRHLSCRAGWISSCYLSLRAAVSLFATSLITPLSLCVIDPLNPSKKHIGLLGVSSSINPTQRHGTKGLMWGARGQFPPAAAMVVMFVLGRWFTSAHNIYFWNRVRVFYRIKKFLV